ncbi:MAG: RNA polymerase sporulation sigma factor SigK [Clostridia bacterium]|nr:RNA polymerase sporulation sigma factor SigK [Clostridia bacterium]
MTEYNKPKRKVDILLEGFFAVLSGVLLLTSGIDNQNSFPHPLSAEKEKEYLDRFHSGDMEARDILIKHNLRLIVYIAKKYTNYPDKDELLSVGTIGLIKAINTYKGDKSTALATYASRCIENEILMALRSYKKHRNNLSLYDEIGTDKDGNQLQIIDMLSIDEDTVYKQSEDEITRQSIRKIIEKYLKPRERKLLVMRFGLDGDEPKTQQETADILGISRSYVSRLEKAILSKLRTALKDENFEF